MASAIAMNRKIASASTGRQTEYSESSRGESNPSRRQARPVLQGTPVQQIWQVTNWHETRFKRLDEFLVALSTEKNMTLLGLNQNRKDIVELQLKNQRLEAEVAALKQHLINQGRNNKKAKKGVSLEVLES